jgi:hypothetical protein
MPDGVVLFQVPFGTKWAILQDTVAATLDRKIRAVGWHFMWLLDSASRRGLGRTDESAIRSALMRALSRVRGRFNAAELDSVCISKYPGFRVARVTLLTRHIQQKTGLDSLKEIVPSRVKTV